MSRFRHLIFCLALALAALGGAGCQTYTQKNTGTPLWKSGSVQAAATEFTRQADKAKDNKDTVIWRLEQGAALRAAGQFQASLAAFEQAEDKINHYEAQAKVKVGRETGAILTTQANLPYEGRDYDKVMLNAYKALNYLQLGEPDKARTEMIRTYQRQQDAVADNRKRIEKEAEEIRQESRNNPSAQRSAELARQDPGFSAKLTGTYGSLDTLRAYADYVNPFPVYLDAVYFLNFSTGGSDLERARKSFERTLGFTGENKFIRQDLEAVAKALRGEPVPAVTYVVFETGCAPWRDQIRLDIPLFFIGQGHVPYAGAAFPALRMDANYLPGLKVAAGGVTESTTLLASMDSVVGQSFKNELPGIITKTLLSTAIKAAASYGVNQAMNDQDALAGLFSRLLTTVAQVAVNIADTRTWTTLPKEFQFCRLPTPADQKIQLTAPGSGQRAEIKVEPNSVNLIYVKSINAVSPLIVNHVRLK